MPALKPTLILIAAALLAAAALAAPDFKNNNRKRFTKLEKSSTEWDGLTPRERELIEVDVRKIGEPRWATDMQWFDLDADNDGYFTHMEVVRCARMAAGFYNNRQRWDNAPKKVLDALQFVTVYDKNLDSNLDDKETINMAWRIKMLAYYHTDLMIKRHDRNRNGELEPDEAKSAVRAMYKDTIPFRSLTDPFMSMTPPDKRKIDDFYR